MSLPVSQSTPAIDSDQLLDESLSALRSENCPTLLAELIEKVRLVLELGVDGNEVLVWQGRLAELQERHAEINSPWNEHRKGCQACIKAGNSYGAP